MARRLQRRQPTHKKKTPSKLIASHHTPFQETRSINKSSSALRRARAVNSSAHLPRATALNSPSHVKCVDAPAEAHLLFITMTRCRQMPLSPRTTQRLNRQLRLANRPSGSGRAHGDGQVGRRASIGESILSRRLRFVSSPSVFRPFHLSGQSPPDRNCSSAEAGI